MPNVILGVTGGIAAYKVADLAGALVKEDFTVKVIMTESAKKFITPLTLAACFTGPAIGMPWWNETRAVYVDGETGVFNYGEIQEFPTLKVGDTVKKGQIIGSVMTVLKKFKGRPMSMLHLELYDHGYTDTWGEWKIGAPKPEHLQDPTEVLKRIIPRVRYIATDMYEESARYFKENQRNCHNCGRESIDPACVDCMKNNLNRWV